MKDKKIKDKMDEYEGLTDKDIVKAVDTGCRWTCPICGKKYQLLHRERGDGKILSHKFEEVIE